MTDTWEDGVDLIHDYGTAVEAVTTAVENAMAAAVALPSGVEPVEALRLLETTLAAHLRQAFENAITAARLTQGAK